MSGKHLFLMFCAVRGGGDYWSSLMLLILYYSVLASKKSIRRCAVFDHFYNSRPNHINCLIIGHVTVKMKIPFVTVNNALQWLFIPSLERVERLVWLSPPQPLSGMNYPWAVKDMKRNVLHVCPSMALIVVLQFWRRLQGDHSRCSQPTADIKTTVLF